MDDDEDELLLAAFAGMRKPKGVSSSSSSKEAKNEKEEEGDGAMKKTMAMKRLELERQKDEAMLKNLTLGSISASDAVWISENERLATTAASMLSKNEKEEKAKLLKLVQDKGLDHISLEDLEKLVGFMLDNEDERQMYAESRALFGKKLCAQGDIRKSINILAPVLKMKPPLPIDDKALRSILEDLKSAYRDIGRFEDAEVCSKRIENLATAKNTSSVVTPPRSTKEVSVTVPEKISNAWEEAIEKCLSGDCSTLLTLLSVYVVSEDQEMMKAIVNLNFACTAIHVAAAVGNERLIKLLVSCGADKSSKANGDGETPIQWAKKFNPKNLSSVSKLLE